MPDRPGMGTELDPARIEELRWQQDQTLPEVEITVRPKAPGAQRAALRITVEDPEPGETRTIAEMEQAASDSERAQLVATR